VFVINSVVPSSTDALHGFHPGVRASGASTTSVGELVVAIVFDVLMFIRFKDLIVILSFFEE
jgi:hypothetical protein